MLWELNDIGITYQVLIRVSGTCMFNKCYYAIIITIAQILHAITLSRESAFACSVWNNLIQQKFFF